MSVSSVTKDSAQQEQRVKMKPHLPGQKEGGRNVRAAWGGLSAVELGRPTGNVSCVNW